MRSLARRWLRQAEADLEAARASLSSGHYEWACFQAQQSAEKALKALLYEKGYTSVITHSLTELVEECQRRGFSLPGAQEHAHFLDMFYVPTRYPNALAGEKAPAEFYTLEDARRCLSSAEWTLTAVKNTLSG